MMTEAILKHEERAMFALRGLYRRYGYAPYKMSRFEEYDLYVRNKDFLVSDQIITFSGDREAVRRQAIAAALQLILEINE